MKISFVSSGGFGAFDGLKRGCTTFKRVRVKHAKGGYGLRCGKFQKGRRHPVCDRRLDGGGRSPGLVRPGPCRVVGKKRRYEKVRRKTSKKARKTRKGGKRKARKAGRKARKSGGGKRKARKSRKGGGKRKSRRGGISAAEVRAWRASARRAGL
jgi:hypothetical protein